jgi:hypothetical protein
MRRWKTGDPAPPDWEVWYEPPLAAGDDPARLIKYILTREEHIELVCYWNALLAACVHDREFEPMLMDLMGPPEPHPDIGILGSIRREVRRIKRRRERARSAAVTPTLRHPRA